MLLLVLAVGAPMGWWARRAQLQRAAVARIAALGGAVLYEFEVLDADGGASAEATDRVSRANSRPGGPAVFVTPSTVVPPAQPWKDRLRRTLGVDFVDNVTQVIALETDKLRDEDLSMLDDLTHVECINLGNSPVGDPAMAHVGRLHRMKILYLDASNLSDAGLAHLARLDRLEHLTLSEVGPKITEAGLRSLEALVNLKTLSIGGTHLSDEAILWLRSALPKARVGSPVRVVPVEAEGPGSDTR